MASNPARPENASEIDQECEADNNPITLTICKTTSESTDKNATESENTTLSIKNQSPAALSSQPASSDTDSWEDISLLEATTAELKRLNLALMRPMQPAVTGKKVDRTAAPVARRIDRIVSPPRAKQESPEPSSTTSKVLKQPSGPMSKSTPSAPSKAGPITASRSAPTITNAAEAKGSKPTSANNKPKSDDSCPPGVMVCPYWVTAPLLGWSRPRCGYDGDHDNLVHRKPPRVPVEPLECHFWNRRSCNRAIRCKLAHYRTLHGCVADPPHKREPAASAKGSGQR